MSSREAGGRVVVAVAPDLMDRSRLASAGDEVVVVGLGRLAATVAARVAEGGVDLVVVDLARPGALDAAVALDVPVIGFAPHVDDELLAQARAVGVQAVPRSQFFRRWPAVGPGTGAGS
jgi:glutamate dehydrogenase/leucine dehydrogenase